MLELIKSQRFQTEYQTYQAKIKNITNDDVRNQATVLLKTLVNEIKKLDNQHQDMFTGNKMPMGLSDSRNNVVTIRKKLDRLFKDWESKNLNG
jgi:hypothetical protein